ncbi:MAG: RNA polymerase subunit sigma-70 [Acidobacteria bacterium]|nr:RNA polymerase subunit sigma-70 [Acidobacteriota bacterium]
MRSQRSGVKSCSIGEFQLSVDGLPGERGGRTAGANSTTSPAALAPAHRREPGGQSLQPTALVHEVYVRLVDQRHVQWRNRAHFFGVAASLMRRILVDHARARLADKRGGGLERVTLAGDEAAESPRIDVLVLHESLQRMAAFSPRQERIVELRYFGGLTIEEAAEVIGISEATLVREWTVAKAWLRADLSDLPRRDTPTA